MGHSPAISGVFSLPAGAPQPTSPARSAGIFGENPGVNRLVRKLPPTVAREVVVGTPGDLIGRPQPSQPFSHISPRLWPLQLADSRPTAASRFGLRLGRQCRVAAATAIALQFPTNGAGMPLQPAGNLTLFSTVVVHLGYDFAFLVGKMMGHRGDSVQKGKFPEKTTLSNLPAMFSPIPVFHTVAIQF
jgi:hypothetical protein